MTVLLPSRHSGIFLARITFFLPHVMPGLREKTWTDVRSPSVPIFAVFAPSRHAGHRSGISVPSRERSVLSMLFLGFNPSPAMAFYGLFFYQFDTGALEFVQCSLNISFVGFDTLGPVYYYPYLEAGGKRIVNRVFQAIVESESADVYLLNA